MRKVYVLLKKDYEGYLEIFEVYSSRTKAEKARTYLMGKYQIFTFEIRTMVLI